MTPMKFTWVGGRQTWYFEPPDFFWKEIFSVTHPDIVIDATS